MGTCALGIRLTSADYIALDEVIEILGRHKTFAEEKVRSLSHSRTTAHTLRPTQLMKKSTTAFEGLLMLPIEGDEVFKGTSDFAPPSCY